MPRKRYLADQLRATPSNKATGPELTAAAKTQTAGNRPSPKAGYTFVQKSGSRAGQSFKIVTGKSGLSERLYASGKTADTTKTRKLRRAPLSSRNTLSNRLRST